MKIDVQYIKDFLEIVLNNNQPDFRIDNPKIKLLWENNDKKLNKLIFHMEILEDQNLIESSTNSQGLGFQRMGNGTFTVSIKPLRLSAAGHQFASDLSKPGVMEQLTTSFKDIGPAEAVKVTFALGKKVIEKKLSALLDE